MHAVLLVAVRDSVRMVSNLDAANLVAAARQCAQIVRALRLPGR